MESEAKKNIEEVHKYLETLFYYSGNVALFEKIKRHVVDGGIENSMDKLVDGVTPEDAMNVVVKAYFKELFHILIPVHIFYNQSFKCQAWIIHSLKRFDPDFAAFIKLLLLEMLNDRQRFDIEDSRLDALRNFVTSFNCKKLKEYPFLSETWLSYFTPEGQLAGEVFANSALSVQGLIKTRKEIKQEEFRTLINKYSEELHEYFSKGNEQKQKGILMGNSTADEEKNTKANTKLVHFFESVSLYKSLMTLLAENGLCNPNTYIFIDQGKGNREYLAAIIKDLHGKGYYKDNKKPTNNQIDTIAIGTFGLNIGIDTIKRTKPKDFDLSFIPPASTLLTQNTLV